VKSGTIFDNVLVADSEEDAAKFAADTFEKTKEGEKKMKEKLDEEERKKAEEEEKKRKEEGEQQ
jgi:calreticulin